VNRLEHARHITYFAVRYVAEDVTIEVHHVSLPIGAREDFRRRLDQPAAGVRYDWRKASVEEALVEMCLAGVSVRRLEDITEALWGTRVSSGTVSRLNQRIYRHIEAWRNREIVGEFPYVYLNGVILKRNWVGEVKNVSVLVAIGTCSAPSAVGVSFCMVASRGPVFGRRVTSLNQIEATASKSAKDRVRHPPCLYRSPHRRGNSSLCRTRFA